LKFLYGKLGKAGRKKKEQGKKERRKEGKKERRKEGKKERREVVCKRPSSTAEIR